MSIKPSRILLQVSIILLIIIQKSLHLADSITVRVYDAITGDGTDDDINNLLGGGGISC